MLEEKKKWLKRQGKKLIKAIVLTFVIGSVGYVVFDLLLSFG